MKLQEVIKQEVDNELADIKWKMKNHVPMELLRATQIKIHALELVLDLIDRYGDKGNFELDDISLEKYRDETN